ncbi:hypothetical protein TCAL_11782 [Tigriopus californicus]|uniref:RNA helicase n=1 Tax=Tigriopus californicus TaxID=6832 RepID=A0A553PFE2_TIGCA|nr:ATP-dependent RNA helicase ddx24-like [Tigriopus californicus]TRY76400.1 hypothetical protein TCAL_11782 [Tigriopus californicus]
MDRMWKQVKLEGSLAAEPHLMGIECLTDYSMLSRTTGVGKKRVISLKEKATVEKKADGRGSAQVDQAHATPNEPLPSRPAQTEKKKEKKKKKPAQVTQTPESGSHIIAEPAADLGPPKPPKIPRKTSPISPIRVASGEGMEKVAMEEPKEEAHGGLEAWHGMGVPPPVLQALHKLQFKQPTPIQSALIPSAILGRMDVVGAAETGSGKTLAFAIPIIETILRERNAGCPPPSSPGEGNRNHVDPEAGEAVDDLSMTSPPPDLKALILTPTRELAVQVRDHIDQLLQFTDIRTAVVFGGLAVQKQTRILSYGPEIVVATPGRLWDLVQEGHPHLSRLSEIKCLAIDETDRMLERGHFEELHNLLELINSDEDLMQQRQNFIFSATLSLVHAAPQHLKQKKRKKELTPSEKLNGLMSLIGVKFRRKVVDLTSKGGPAASIMESRITCAFSEKDIYLCYFLKKHPGRTLVFCNSIDCVRRLVNLFTLLGVEPLGLHAQMHQKQRLKNLERFTKLPNGILMATDVAARGLDIPNVDHVIHYQVPKTSESYVHRSGRTARATNDGISVILMEPAENFDYKKLCKTLGKDEDLPEFPIDRVIYRGWHDVLQVARELDKLKLSVRKEDAQKKWWEKAAEEADLIVSSEDEDDDERANNRFEAQKQRVKIRKKQQQLQEMLLRMGTNVRAAGKYPTMSGHLVEMEDEPKMSAIDTLSLETTMKKKDQIIRRKTNKNNFKRKHKKKNKKSV